MITEEKLKIKKYQYYTGYSQYSDFFYQKCFSDKIGKKYFINIIHYPQDHLPHATWSAEMTVNEPSMKFSMYCLENRSIGYVEKKMKRFWECMGKYYYEKF